MIGSINNHEKIKAFINAVGLIQVLLFTLYFLYKSKSNKTFLYFGLFLLVYASGLFVFFIMYFKLHPKVEYLPINFNLLSMPLLYLYVFKVSVYKDIKIYYLIFIPALIEFLSGFILLYINNENLLFNFLNQTYYFFSYDLFVPYSIFIALLIIRLINKHTKVAKEQYSNTRMFSLNWCKTIAIIQILFFVVYLALLYFIKIFKAYANAIDIFLTIANVLFIYWMAIKGLEQKSIQLFLEINNFNKQDDAGIVKTKNNLPINYISDNFKIINNAIIENRLYTDVNLTIIDIAKVVDIHQKKISQIINLHTKQNFNSYINNFRVAEAKRMLKDNQYNNLSIDGIGIESGFNSKSAFYKAFKNCVGLTPKRYRENRLL